MGITDVFKTKQFKSDIERLTAENEYLNSLLTPEMRTAVSINTEIQRLKIEKGSINREIDERKKSFDSVNKSLQSLEKEIAKKYEKREYFN